jgi:uncharacterized RDD family membrane protein YckC
VDLEDRLVTATPEGVSVEVVLAGLGSRFAAIMLDTVVQLSILVPVAGGIAGLVGATGLGLVGLGLLSVLVLLDLFGYFVLLECLTGGRTLGKLAAGLRAVRVDGRPVGFVASVVRTVLRIVDYLTLGLFIVATRRNQRLGDLAAGTIVVRERRAAAPPRPPAPDRLAPAASVVVVSAWAEPLDARGWDVTAVTAEEAALVERFLRGRHAYRDDARARLAARLANRLAPRVAGNPPGLVAERFLEGVAAAKVGGGWAVAPRGWVAE